MTSTIQNSQILNGQFVSAFTKDDMISPPTVGTSTSNTAPPLNIQVNGVKKTAPCINSIQS